MQRRRLNDWVILALVALWPFAYLLPYVLPIKDRFLSIGNDFYPLYFKYKPYILDLLNSFHFPLWSPSEGGGYPFFANPFAQALYPLNLPLAILYRIAGGYHSFDHQRFTVLGISIFAVGTYLWLRSMNINRRPALFATLVMSGSYKVVELIRFPNAIHTACWYPWIMYAMAKIVSSPSKKKAILFGLLLVFSAFCLITGGYPYYLYYSLFLILPFGIMILIPGWQEKVFNIKGSNLRQSLIIFGAAGVLLFLISAPYLLQLYHLIMQTADRSGTNFSFATDQLFNFEDTLGSLVYPPASQAEGWYHFGFVGLFLILIFLLGIAKPRSQENSFTKYDTIIKVLLVVWLLTISYITYGKESLLFTFLWRVLPGFSNLRVWGRMNIILVPILAWLLALAYQYFEKITVSSEKPSPDTGRVIKRGVSILVGTFAIVLSIQGFFIYRRVTDYYWSKYFLVDFLNLIPAYYLKSGWLKSLPSHINNIFIGFFVIMGFISFLICLFFLLRARFFKPFPATSVFILLLAISVLNTISVAPWMWTLIWDHLPCRSLLNILIADKESFNTARKNTYDTISLDASFNRGIIDNWYFVRYIAFIKRTEDEPKAVDLLMGGENGQKVYFSTVISSNTIQAFLDDASRFAKVARVDTYDGDTLKLTVEAPQEGYVSFIDNWDPNWKAAVDGRQVEVEQLFGTFKSVKVTEGYHQVVFAYCPPVFEILNPYCSKIR